MIAALVILLAIVAAFGVIAWAGDLIADLGIVAVTLATLYHLFF